MADKTADGSDVAPVTFEDPMQRAKALNASRLIPANWNGDGSTKRSDESSVDWRLDALRGTVERRDYSIDGLECRSDATDGTIRMGGWASVFDYAYDIGGGRTETIARGAFRRTIAEQPRVVLLANHEGLPLASTSNGSLRLAEDERGLRWDADLDPEDEQSRTLARKVRSGLLTDCSFAFRCTDDDWNGSHRTVRSVTLHKGDVSICTYGASDATSVTARSRRVGPVDASPERRVPLLDHTTSARMWLDAERDREARERSAREAERELKWLEAELERYGK